MRNSTVIIVLAVHRDSFPQSPSSISIFRLARGCALAQGVEKPRFRKQRVRESKLSVGERWSPTWVFAIGGLVRRTDEARRPYRSRCCHCGRGGGVTKIYGEAGGKYECRACAQSIKTFIPFLLRHIVRGPEHTLICSRRLRQAH